MGKEEDIGLFTFIKQIQSKKRTIPYDSKIAPAFMLSQFLSMNKKYIKTVNKINQYQFLLPDEIIYNYYMSAIPEIPYNERFAKFIKKRKENEETKKRIEKLKDLYPTMSTRECKMLITTLKEKK
jgi:hypothetical protein